MALDYQEGAERLWNHFQSEFYSETRDDSMVSTIFANIIASDYETYSDGGIVLGANNNSANKGFIYTALIDLNNSSYNGNAPESIARLARGFTDFWASAFITPDTPAHGGIQVVSVTNDAQLYYQDFYDAIYSFVGQYGTVFNPPYEELFLRLETVVRQIKWFVTERFITGTGTVDTVFIEFIT